MYSLEKFMLYTENTMNPSNILSRFFTRLV